MTPPTCPDTPTRRQLLSTTVAATTLALAGCIGNSDYSVNWDSRSESRDEWDYATVYGTVTNNTDFAFGVEIVATFTYETVESDE